MESLDREEIVGEGSGYTDSKKQQPTVTEKLASKMDQP